MIRGFSQFLLAAALSTTVLASGQIALAVDGSANVPQSFDTCFSPNGNCDQKIIAFIATAQSTIDMAIYSLTLPGIGKALEDAQARGVRVRIVADRQEACSKSSLITRLDSENMLVKIGHVQGLMHDKYTIIDGRMVEFGSYNYSSGATSRNAENQFYIDLPQVVSHYVADFEALFADGLPVAQALANGRSRSSSAGGGAGGGAGGEATLD